MTIYIFLLSAAIHCACAAFMKPIFYPNGTIGVQRIETGDSLSTPEGKARSTMATDQNKFNIPLTQRDITWLDSLISLPLKGDSRIRKEYRTLTDLERNRFHRAVSLLKQDTSVTINKYDLLSNIHSRSSSSAHAGPGFFGWHRVFLLMFENALRQIDPTVTVPYWDITLEEGMQRPYESALFSPVFMGTGTGQVTDGPFRDWITPFGYGPLRRQIVAQGRLMSPKHIEGVMNKTYLAEITYFNANLTDNFEAIHNRVHVWIGGQMRNIEIGAVDPIFYLIHSFVDLIWENFRNKQREFGVNPELDYPLYYGLPNHAPFAPMGLGRLLVVDGLHRIWSEHISYDARPVCDGPSVCGGTVYLKCDVSINRCIPRTTAELFLLQTTPLNSTFEPYVPTNNFNSNTEFINIPSDHFDAIPHEKPSIVTANGTIAMHSNKTNVSDNGKGPLSPVAVIWFDNESTPESDTLDVWSSINSTSNEDPEQNTSKSEGLEGTAVNSEKHQTLNSSNFKFNKNETVNIPETTHVIPSNSSTAKNTSLLTVKESGRNSTSGLNNSEVVATISNTSEVIDNPDISKKSNPSRTVSSVFRRPQSVLVLKMKQTANDLKNSTTSGVKSIHTLVGTEDVDIAAPSPSPVPAPPTA